MEPSLNATLLTTAQVPCSEGSRAETCPPLYAHTQNPPRAAKRAAYCDFVCRVDILWTILFFVLLFSVGLCTSVVTQTLLSTAVFESWHKLHALHVNVTSKQLSQQISAAYGLAVHILPLQVRYPVLMQSEDTLATLCALLTAYDKYTSFDTLSVTSLTLQEAIACIHGFTDDESTDSLAGYVSYNHTVNATYYVDKDTYHFQRPLRAAMVWPFAARNVSSIINESTSIAPISRATHNPSIGHRNAWRVHPILPHLMEMEVPIGIEYRDPLAPEITSTDYVHLYINASRLLREPDGTQRAGARIALLISQSLDTPDPTIMSNNWGQQSILNSTIYTPLLSTNVTYLKVSDVRDPLMRAALKYVDLTALQNGVSSSTVEFQHDGAPAIVTAWTCTTSGGLSLPLIYASMQTSITMPLTRIRHINNGIVAFTVLLLTLSFWYLIHRTVSKPLSGVQASLFASVKHGGRQLYHAGGSKLIRFAEFDALIQAHNETMKQLRNVDAFVPESLRQRVTDSTASRRYDSPAQRSSRPLTNRRRRKLKATKLSLHLSTVVYVSTTPIASHTTAQSSPHSSPFSEEQEPLQIRGQRLIAAAEKTAHAANTANSGPFPTPAALTAFLTAVQELCRTHHGTLHRVCPDACVLHFHSAVRAHLPRGQGAASPAAAPTMRHGVPAAQPAPQPQALAPPEETWRHAAQDARRAAAFALDLVSWVDAQGGSGASARGGGASPMPDVHALLDTSLFTCGQYCPAGSEQTLQVALGRDVQRALGRVPQRIGVRVAVTEETATLLRAEVRRRSRGCGTVDHGVRLIPVDVLRTGRAGLDSEVVVLYEALPGRVVGDAAWQRYARCCCDGFAHMLRGDYAGALNAYRGVAEIEDLEPGLLPPSMRREAAASAATGGAASEQVGRLVRECEHRVRWRITEPLCRTSTRPLNLSQVLSKRPSEDVVEGGHPESVHETAREVERGVTEGRQRLFIGRAVRDSREFSNYPEIHDRSVVYLQERQMTLRCVLPSAPRWIRDHMGLYWHLSRRKGEGEGIPVWQGMQMALGSAGFIASVSFFTFRDVHPVVAKTIRDAPPGPMSDTLRSATPVCGPSPTQEAFMKAVLVKYQYLRHPNIISLIGYSHSLEGGVVLIWEFSPGGTLRELLNRYGRLPTITTIRFGLQVLSALSFLHEHNVAHGNLNLDTVMVDSDGSCRLVGLYMHERIPFVLPGTHYMSPAMATGTLPTPPCDLFCYGLLALEALTGEPCWRWTTNEDGQPFGTIPDLLVLMQNGGQAFCDAVVEGRVVANAEAFDTPMFAEKYSELARSTLRCCVSHTPSKRPTAVEVRNIVKILLSEGGLACEEDEV
ncbi:hypothetical protein, unknown function [Leishmania braziliensis MHOM/BR/75/M2904]|uniref:Protein kinase domain-containing protein n=1 Tax=Leishmania braziliensis TaxID=5660 RepID=A4HJG7_LEIBR|nr:hypothetical protein, unknown function [Leishmania braziliensis MHOM/BR/75/M2904]CAM42628.1 hypothetical protein, unknown function [Leishmania braziliensis MHOM/BR/75/M2904]